MFFILFFFIFIPFHSLIIFILSLFISPLRHFHAFSHISLYTLMNIHCSREHRHKEYRVHRSWLEPLIFRPSFHFRHYHCSFRSSFRRRWLSLRWDITPLYCRCRAPEIERAMRDSSAISFLHSSRCRHLPLTLDMKVMRWWQIIFRHYERRCLFELAKALSSHDIFLFPPRAPSSRYTSSSLMLDFLLSPLPFSFHY